MPEATVAVLTEKPVAPYALSKDVFIKPFLDKSAPYKSGDVVTRANFAAFLINSFAISKGKLQVQETYFHWLQDNSGFDYRETLKGFADAGGWESLSQGERVMIIAAVRRRPKHRNDPIKAPERTDVEIADIFMDQLEQLQELKVYVNPIVAREKLKGMSFKDFNARVSDFIKNPPVYVPEYVVR